MPTPRINTQIKLIPIGILQDPVFVRFSVPKFIQFATKIPRVMKSWYVLQRFSKLVRSSWCMHSPYQSTSNMARGALTLIHRNLLIGLTLPKKKERVEVFDVRNPTNRDSAPTPRPAIHLPTTTATVSY
jgi:hypothetical protein